MKRVIVAMVLLFLLGGISQAELLLYDFEQSWQFEEWTTADAESQRCFPSDKYAVSGEKSIGFISRDSSRKPHLQVIVWDNDWEQFDYLSMVITNPTSSRIPLQCRMANENGYNSFVTLDPMSSMTYVLRIKFPKYARKNNILTLELTAMEKMDVEFYVDQIELHREGKEPKIEGEKRKKDLTAYPVESIMTKLEAMIQSQIRANVEAIGPYFDGLNLDIPMARKALIARGQSLIEAIDDETLHHDQRAMLLLESEHLKMAADRFVQINGFVSHYKGPKENGFIVGFADSMNKVMPRDVAVDLAITDEVRLSLAGNEKEAVQLAVVPYARDLQDVTVVSSDLKSRQGETIPAESIECDLVGFVKTHGISDNYPRYIGWYPDPLIRNPKAVDVNVGDIQTWWIRVRARENQPAGNYQGTITVTSKGNKPVAVALNVRVYDFNVPKCAPIPTAITYDAYKHPTIGGEERWDKELKYVHADFLADYMMNMDSIYRDKTKPLDWELLEYCNKKGQLSAINLGYFYDSKDESVADFKASYDKAKALGMLDYCYIYGFDEQGRSTYKWINEACEKFNKAYPEVMVMVTAQDHSYGYDEEMPDLSAWCPIINRYNPTLTEKARKDGRRVWWYTCNWPKAPYPNIYVDYSAMEVRVLTGLMHAKYQPDGFLYYHMSIFGKQNNKGITTYPWTDWDPWNFVSTNGDGQLFCIDKDGYPVATIRVENYRDGFEDLAYIMILENQVEQYSNLEEKQDEDWYHAAKKVLERTDRLVRARYDFTRKPESIRRYRVDLARLIETSPVQDTNPWKEGFSIWGIKGQDGR